MNQIDEYEQRMSLRRSRFRWRVIALVAVLCVAALLMGQMPRTTGPHVAHFDVEGVIASDVERVRLLHRIAENDAVEALVVRINSPGGTVTGSEELYDALRTIAAAKPVVATMGDVAASGGYIAALAADRVFAMGNTITGSVGVIFQAPNVHELMERVGVQMVEIKSGDLKAEPNPFKPVDPEVIAAERVLVEDSFQWFLDLVRERRGIDGDTLAEIGRGGIFTGRMALERGLIDGVGGLDEARAWLRTEHDVAADLPLVPYAIEEEGSFPLDFLLGSAVMSGARDALGGLDMGGRLGTGLWAIYR